MAEILIKYRAEAGELEAAVNKINEANDEAVKSAAKASDKIAAEYKSAAKSAAAAFSGGEVKKALEGSTTALERLTKSGKSLTGQLRGLKAELTLLEQQGKDNTAEFNQLLIAASKLEDQIGDTRARVKILASDTFKFDAAVQATQGLAAGFEVAQGAAALFGSESEDLQKAILKVQGAIAVANGVQQIANLLLEESAVKTAVLSGAQKVYTFVTNGAAVATKLWRAALVATGLGALIALIGTLASSFLDTAEATDDAAESARNYQKAIDELNQSAQKSSVNAGNAQIQLLQKQGKISEEQAKKLISFNKLQIGLSDAATTAKEKETEAFKRFEEQKADDVKNFGKVTKATQLQLSNDLKAIETERANIEKQLRTENKIEQIEIAEDLDNKRKEQAKKAAEAQKKANEAAKKAAEDQLKVRERLAQLENEAFVLQLSEQEKLLNESNEKILELEKTFTEARFKAGTVEAIQAEKDLANAIETIKADTNKKVAELNKKDLEESVAKQLEAAKAGADATTQQQITALQTQRDIELANAEALGKDKVEITTRYNSQIADLNKQLAQSEYNTKVDTLKALELVEGSSLDRRLELINIEAERRKQEAKDSIDDANERAAKIKLIEAETQAAIREEQKKTRAEQIAQIEEVAQATAGAFGAYVNLVNQISEQRVNSITQASELELKAINDSQNSEITKERQRETLKLKTERAIAKEKTKQAMLDKQLALFNAIISTAAAIAKVSSNPVLVALAAATGALQIATIASQPIPKYARGGLIGGRLHSGGGTLIEAERDEYIINRNQSMKHRRELDAINTSSEAFRRLIDERYVRPAINYYLGKKERGLTLNASLNSKTMERELKGMRKDLKRQNTVININASDNRYTWQ